MVNIPQQLVNAIFQGSVYALIALGYTMVFGVMRLINFAHGEIMMAGAYFGYVLCTWLNLNVFIGIIITAAICGVLGVLLERVAYRPLRKKGGMAVLISAVGASIFLQYLFMTIFSARPRAFSKKYDGAVYRIGENVSFSQLKVMVLIICVAALIALAWFLKKTKQGLAMRAVACEPLAAQVCGIDNGKIRSLCFFVGSSLAGIAGVLFGMCYTITPFMGQAPGMKAFCAAVVGGVGSIPGAVIGGYAIAVCEVAAAAFLSSAYKDAVAYVLLIVVLLIMPAGIMGLKGNSKRA